MWRRFQTLLEAKLFVSWQTTFPFLRLLRPNWIFLEKYAIFETYGDVFAVVTPAGCELFIADSKAAQQILMRKNDFPKPIDLTSTQIDESCRLFRGANKITRKTWGVWEEFGYCMGSLVFFRIFLFLC
jgi:hypothetical protein